MDRKTASSSRQPSLAWEWHLTGCDQKGVSVGDSAISNGILTVHFDASSGRISLIEDLVANVNVSASQDFVWYNSSAGDNGDTKWGNDGTQNSGAYIFRPNSSEPYAVGSVGRNGLRANEIDSLLPAKELERRG